MYSGPSEKSKMKLSAKAEPAPNFLKHFYFHIKQPIFLITHITRTRRQMTTQSLIELPEN